MSKSCLYMDHFMKMRFLERFPDGCPVSTDTFPEPVNIFVRNAARSPENTDTFPETMNIFVWSIWKGPTGTCTFWHKLWDVLG